MGTLINSIKTAIELNEKSLDKYEPQSGEFSFIIGYNEALKNMEKVLKDYIKKIYAVSLN